MAPQCHPRGGELPSGWPGTAQPHRCPGPQHGCPGLRPRGCACWAGALPARPPAAGAGRGLGTRSSPRPSLPWALRRCLAARRKAAVEGLCARRHSARIDAVSLRLPRSALTKVPFFLPPRGRRRAQGLPSHSTLWASGPRPGRPCCRGRVPAVRLCLPAAGPSVASRTWAAPGTRPPAPLRESGECRGSLPAWALRAWDGARPLCPPPLRSELRRGGFGGGQRCRGAGPLPHGAAAAVLEPAVRCSCHTREYHCLPGFQFRMASENLISAFIISQLLPMRNNKSLRY